MGSYRNKKEDLGDDDWHRPLGYERIPATMACCCDVLVRKKPCNLALEFQISKFRVCMRHGRRRPNSFLSSISKPSPSPPPPPPPADLPNLLLVASLSKTLASSSTRLLDSFPIPISQSLVLQILRKNSLTPSIKIEFFHWASLGPNYKHSAVMLFSTFWGNCLI
ncbi:pentatricopeptide repeat-containing protein [Cinnamomum micranthum f. kanehirae]|uniref:Pentatricopeptide repeat-containing protein n=1 Tax=Cinnamomum micranthum f. kanehirae TaxID=337451 RepID=A0A3S3QYZ2_9MAGN|nr:pentatricopeptide repeat-containing protein [Cinnamomum micranthum f. kanehirae]